MIAAGREIHEPPKNASRLCAMFTPFKKAMAVGE